jgi:hypothetical protein
MSVRNETSKALSIALRILVLVVSLAIGVVPLLELNSRSKTADQLQRRIDSLRAELAPSLDKDKNRIRALQNALDAQGSLALLSAGGAENLCLTRSKVAVDAATYDACLKERPASPIRMLFPDTWPDAALFLLASICCGVFGRFAWLLKRDATAIPLRELGLGVAAGFIVYVTVEAGWFILLVKTPLPLNPWVYAAAATLAGMFSDRAYDVLESAVNKLMRR